jgi:hypothetical protein
MYLLEETGGALSAKKQAKTPGFEEFTPVFAYD